MAPWKLPILDSYSFRASRITVFGSDDCTHKICKAAAAVAVARTSAASQRWTTR